MNIYETFHKYEPRSLQHEVPVLWQSAFRNEVRGLDQYNHMKSYLDFTSGIFVASIGHSHPSVQIVIIEQAKKLLHSYAFYNEPRRELVKKLVDITGMEKVYLCSTGSEAVEAALRCMWAYKKTPTYHVIDGLLHSFHGNTWGSRSLIHKHLCKGATLTDNCCGLVIESYFGYNAEFHDKGWIQQLLNEAKGRDIPVCFDEVQAGFGRTGKMFGYQHYDVKPDLIVVGKALGGGLPISAVIGRADLLDAPDDLSSTHTGNPVCCAAALATLEVLEDGGLVERARQMGEILEVKLHELFPEYKINGRGMIWGIDLKNIELAEGVVYKCADKGLLLVNTRRGTIKIGAPLVTPIEEMYRGLTIIREALNET